MWTVLFTKNAEKDKPKLKETGLEKKTKALLTLLSESPFQTPPSYEKLVGDLNGYYFVENTRLHMVAGHGAFSGIIFLP